jgi:hypothetical protein
MKSDGGKHREGPPVVGCAASGEKVAEHPRAHSLCLAEQAVNMQVLAWSASGRSLQGSTYCIGSTNSYFGTAVRNVRI